MYEAPTISEYISNGFLQGIVSRYIAYKINKKWIRYEKRMSREKFLQAVHKDDIKFMREYLGNVK